MNAQELAEHLTQKLAELTVQTEILKTQLPSDATIPLNNEYHNASLLYQHDTYLMKVLNIAIENIKNGKLCHCKCTLFYNSYLCSECSKVICGDCSYDRTCQCTCRVLYKI